MNHFKILEIRGNSLVERTKTCFYFWIYVKIETYEYKGLKQPSSALLGPAMAKLFFPRDTADFITVVPRKFSASTNVGTSKESNPRETQIVRIDEHVLHENVRIARVLNAERKMCLNELTEQ